MAFDFSKYTPQDVAQTAATPAATPTSTDPQYDPAMTNQIWSVMNAGPQGVEIDPGLKAARDYLMDKGLLQDVPANQGDSNTDERYTLGLNAPHNFSLYSLTGDTPADERSRLTSVQDVQGNGQKLYNPSDVKTDPLYGDMTHQGNVDANESGLMKAFWKVAPMLPGALAFGAPMMFGGLAGAGGATAGALVGDQTPGMFGGALNTGASAVGDNVFAGLPASLQKYLPEAIKQGIKGLGSNNGKFDFSKYISPAITQAIKGLG
jgi:hypothetical protein